MNLFSRAEASIQEVDPLQPVINTPLGIIEISLSVSNQSYLPTQCFRLKHGGFLYQYDFDLFDCELVICKPKLYLASHLSVEECWGAVFRIKPKQDHQIDMCSFSAYWQKGYSWKDYGPNSGEHLEANEYENEKYRLHIGTQDGPLLMARRNQGDRIPKSLSLDSDFEQHGFIVDSDKGIEIPMTRIESQEICQVHFVTAWNRKIEDDVSTWLAVDLSSKQILDGEELF